MSFLLWLNPIRFWAADPLFIGIHLQVLMNKAVSFSVRSVPKQYRLMVSWMPDEDAAPPPHSGLIRCLCVRLFAAACFLKRRIFSTPLGPGAADQSSVCTVLLKHKPVVVLKSSWNWNACFCCVLLLRRSGAIHSVGHLCFGSAAKPLMYVYNKTNGIKILSIK